MGEIGKTQIKS